MSVVAAALRVLALLAGRGVPSALDVRGGEVRVEGVRDRDGDVVAGRERRLSRKASAASSFSSGLITGVVVSGMGPLCSGVAPMSDLGAQGSRFGSGWRAKGQQFSSDFTDQRAVDGIHAV